MSTPLTSCANVHTQKSCVMSAPVPPGQPHMAPAPLPPGFHGRRCGSHIVGAVVSGALARIVAACSTARLHASVAFTSMSSDVP